MTTTSETLTTESTGTPLYHEVSGQGPVALLIPGAPGDGSQFALLAAELGDNYTVVTYDRRGTSRSPRPHGWTTTTVAEQADDAAALLARVTSEPALVYGTSNGALVALELALRHPQRVSTAIVHEAPLLGVLADPAPIGEMLGELIGTAMERGGPTEALDAFLRFAFGDQIVDGLPADIRARMYSNAEMVFAIEMPGFQAYRPDEAALRALTVLVRVFVGEDQPAPFFAEAGLWIAAHANTIVAASPGAHAPHLSHPRELAAFIAEHDPTR